MVADQVYSPTEYRGKPLLSVRGRGAWSWEGAAVLAPPPPPVHLSSMASHLLVRRSFISWRSFFLSFILLEIIKEKKKLSTKAIS